MSFNEILRTVHYLKHKKKAKVLSDCSCSQSELAIKVMQNAIVENSQQHEQLLGIPPGENSKGRFSHALCDTNSNRGS